MTLVCCFGAYGCFLVFVCFCFWGCLVAVVLGGGGLFLKKLSAVIHLFDVTKVRDQNTEIRPETQTGGRQCVGLVRGESGGKKKGGGGEWGVVR